MCRGKKRILILGAGVMQGPAITSAKTLGLETIVIDGDPNAVLAHKADHFEVIDLKDIYKIEEFAQKLQKEGGLDGVMTAGTDFSASVAFVSQSLGLPGIPYEAALDASDKERMRRRFREAGLPSPNFLVFTNTSINELPFGFPVVVKPVDNMGGRGCRKVDKSGELGKAVENALEFSRSGRVIVEEYMEGPEFSVDAVIFNGEVTICGLADRHIFFPPYFIEMGHTMPANFTQKDRENVKGAIIEVFIRGIKALGITNGAAKGDIKLTSRGPMIGEIAARLSGGYMSGWTYPYASGVNPVEGAIAAALGNKPENLEPKHNWTSAERAFISIPGIVKSIEGLETVRNMPHIKNLFLRCESGQRISFPENNVSKAGNVISAAPDRDIAVQAAENAAKSVLIRLAAPDETTEAYLASVNSFPPSAYNLDPAQAQELSCPAFLESDIVDFAGRSPRETFEAVQKLTGLELETAAIGGKRLVLDREFWKALIRGGYQGAVYYIDKQICRI